MALRVVFMGTPQFAATILRCLADSDQVELAAVYTQPDRPAGRGKKLQASPTKSLALDLGLPVLQPANFKDPADIAALAAFKPDVLAVAAYGLLLPQAVLDLPLLAPLNVHASLLPQYRGAAPIQRALLHGDAITGISIMRMEAGLDTGPVLLQQALRIDPQDTGDSLFDLLAESGAKLLLGGLRMLEENRAAFTPQNDALATHAPKLLPQEEWIDWQDSAANIHNKIRALHSKPGGRTKLRLEGADELLLRLAPGSFIVDEASPWPPGSLYGFDGENLRVACGNGVYLLSRLQPAGKSMMNARDFYNGRLRNKAEPYATLGS